MWQWSPKRNVIVAQVISVFAYRNASSMRARLVSCRQDSFRGVFPGKTAVKMGRTSCDCHESIRNTRGATWESSDRPLYSDMKGETGVALCESFATSKPRDGSRKVFPFPAKASHKGGLRRGRNIFCEVIPVKAPREVFFREDGVFGSKECQTAAMCSPCLGSCPDDVRCRSRRRPR